MGVLASTRYPKTLTIFLKKYYFFPFRSPIMTSPTKAFGSARETTREKIEVYQKMAQGTVKWFKNEKGFGFIAQDGGEDVFVHHSSIQSEGFRTLNEGDRVEFNVVRGDKGLKAENVVKIG